MKNKWKKFVLIELEIKHGEISLDAKSVHEVGSAVDIQNFAEAHAQRFYATNDDPDEELPRREADGTYDCGFALVKLAEVRKIPAAHYQVLKQYL